MARLYYSGGEFNDLTAEGLTTVGTGSSLTFYTTTKRSGAYSYKQDSAVGAVIGNWYASFSGVLDRNYFLRFYVYFETNLPANALVLGRFFTSSGSGICNIRTANSGKLALFSDATGLQIGSDSPQLAVNTWYRVELECRVVTGGGVASTAKARLDGAEFASSVAVNISATAPGRAVWGLSSGTPAASRVTLFDDIALNDDQGADQNSYPGSAKIVLQKPISDNARVGWVTGNSATTSLFDAVDNLPPIGVVDTAGTATSQIKDANSNTTDTYDANLTTYLNAGMNEADRVAVVAILAMGSTSSLTSTNDNIISLVSNPVIADQTYSIDATIAGTYPTGWHRSGLLGITYNPTVTKSSSPVMRDRKGTAATRVHSVCLMGLLTEYVPSSLPPPIPMPMRRQRLSHNRR